MQLLPRSDAVSATIATAPALAPRRWAVELRVALAGLALLLLWDMTTLDLVFARVFGDAAGFAWRAHWLTGGLLHQGGRALAWCAALAVGLNMVRPLLPLQTRRERIWWLAMTVFCAVLIPLFKRVSATSCPWDLAEFGGIAQYVSHWRFGSATAAPAVASRRVMRARHSRSSAGTSRCAAPIRAPRAPGSPACSSPALRSG